MTSESTGLQGIAQAAQPQLVLIHGWACHAGFWEVAFPYLRSWARVVTLDLPGHRSEAAGPISITRLAEAVVERVEALGLSAPVLVGHSMGGPVAIEAAIQLGARCRLVLGIDTFDDPAFYRRRPLEEIESRLAAYDDDHLGTLSAMVRQITLGGGADLPAWITGEMGALPEAWARAALVALLEWEILDRWPLLPCPAETINSAELSRGMKTVELPGLRVHLMKGVGHFPMLEEPEGLARLIRQAVERHR